MKYILNKVLVVLALSAGIAHASTSVDLFVGPTCKKVIATTLQLVSEKASLEGQPIIQKTINKYGVEEKKPNYDSHCQILDVGVSILSELEKAEGIAVKVLGMGVAEEMAKELINVDSRRQATPEETFSILSGVAALAKLSAQKKCDVLGFLLLAMGSTPYYAGNKTLVEDAYQKTLAAYYFGGRASNPYATEIEAVSKIGKELSSKVGKLGLGSRNVESDLKKLLPLYRGIEAKLSERKPAEENPKANEIVTMALTTTGINPQEGSRSRVAGALTWLAVDRLFGVLKSQYPKLFEEEQGG